MSNDWPFEDPPNLAVFTTSQVLEGHPVLFVTHDDEDGAWQFVCGTTDDTDDLRVVSLKSMLDREPAIAQVADLPYGWLAWRETSQSDWQRSINGDDE